MKLKESGKEYNNDHISNLRQECNTEDSWIKMNMKINYSYQIKKETEDY